MLNADTLATDSLAALPFYEWPAVAPTPTAEVSGLLDPESLLLYRPSADTLWRPSMFGGQELAPTHAEALLRPDTTIGAWVFVALIGLATLTLIYHLGRKLKMVRLLAACIDRRSLDRLGRDANLQRAMLAMPMGLLYCAAIGSAAWIAALQPSGFVGWAALCIGLGAAYLLRNGILRMLGSVFGNQSAIHLYITSNYVFHLIAATALLPLLFLQAYLPQGGDVVAKIVAALVAATYVVRLVRGLKLFLTFAHGPNLFLFYYLCTVEIVPILVFAKWIISL